MARLLTRLSFGEWLPDLPEHGNPGSPVVQNALWVNGGYRPADDFASLGANLSARCQGAFAGVDSNGDTHIYAGTASGLLEYNGTSGSGGFSSRGTGFGTADGGYWKFTEFSSPGFEALVVATNFADAVQCLNAGDTSFAPLGGNPPKAAAVATVNQFLMLGNTDDGVNGAVPNRVQWCGLAMPTRWDFGTLAAQQAQAGEQYLSAVYGLVTHIADGYAYGLIFQQRGITRAYYVGGDAIFNFDTYEKQRGAYYPNSPIQLGNLVYFVAEDGFCMTDGQQVVQIGHGKVDNTFLNDVSQAYADRVCSAYDPVNKLIYWCYCSSGNSTGIPDRCIAYNYADQRFMPTTNVVSRIFTSKSFGFTMETLDNVNTDLDLVTPSLDDPFWQGGNLQVQAFNASNNYGQLGGDPLDAVIDTLEAAPNPGGITYIDGARPVVTAPQTGSAAPSVQLLSRNLENAGYATSAPATQDPRTGICNLRASARYVRLRVGLPGGATGGFGVATGVDVYGAPAGDR
ncbi:MAG TPA: hypothetical protein VLV87_08695 [Gammaproteobacteria bacterium]|nr:hypothetical protein [Gammaproteobacteria bacterium]